MTAAILLFGLSGAAAAEEERPVQLNATLAPQIAGAQPDTSAVSVPVPSDKALRYYRSGNLLWCAVSVWRLLIPALFLFTALSARLRSWAERLGRKWYFAFALYCIALLALSYLVNLPWSYYLGFVRLHSYDLSSKPFSKWLLDSLKALSVTLVIWLAVGWVPFLLARKCPRRWWLYTGLLAIPFLCVGLLIGPVVIDPLFNRFQPLQDKALEARILALSERAGIEGGRVFEVNKSIDTKTLNAYVNGFMGTKRIVFWDTALRTLDQDELLAVMGHEMGHYVLGHVVKSLMFASALIFAGLYATHRLAERIIGRFKERLGFATLSDFAALPLAILLVNFLSLMFAPIEMAFSRYQEHEADRFGLELTHNNHATATALLKLQQHNLSNPRPGLLYKLWRASHPPIGERIDFCNSYRPWETGQPSRYENYIKPQAPGANSGPR